MEKREANTTFNIGDRIPYILIMGCKGSKNYENSEDPLEVLDKDKAIDYDYYINK